MLTEDVDDRVRCSEDITQSVAADCVQFGLFLLQHVTWISVRCDSDIGSGTLHAPPLHPLYNGLFHLLPYLRQLTFCRHLVGRKLWEMFVTVIALPPYNHRTYT